MSRGLRKGYLLSLALGKGSISLEKDHLPAPLKARGRCAHGLGKELPSMQLGPIMWNWPIPT